MKDMYKKVNGQRVKMSEEECKELLREQMAYVARQKRKVKKEEKIAAEQAANPTMSIEDKFDALITAIANAKSLKDLKSAEIVKGIKNKKQAK